MLASDLGKRFEAFAAQLDRPVAFFDIEATGTDPVHDRIVELSVVRLLPGGALEEPSTWRINPQVRIPSEAIEIHGITNEAVETAPLFRDIAEDVERAFTGCDLAGFSIGRFDIRILQAELSRSGRALDLSQARMIDAQVIYHSREPRNLAAALRFYRGKELENAHGAQADTIASLEVFAGQLDRYDDLAIEIDALHQVSAIHNGAYCDSGRRFFWRDNEPAFNFGRLRGKALRWIAADPVERKYLRWFLEGHFENDAKTIVRDALMGKIRRRSTPGDKRPAESTDS